LADELYLQLHFDLFKSDLQRKNPGRNIFEKNRVDSLGRRSWMEEIAAGGLLHTGGEPAWVRPRASAATMQ